MKSGRADLATRYAEIFDAPKRKRAAPVEIVGTDEDASELVERMIAAVTAAVKAHFTGPLVERQLTCGICANTDEPHYHGATLYQAGKELY